MGDDTTSDSDLETFDVEFTAAELYALQGILRYHSIEMEYEQAYTAQSLAQKILEKMATDTFNNTLQQEADKFREEELNQNGQMSESMGNVTMGGFQ